jgi:hypothetical protein
MSQWSGRTTKANNTKSKQYERKQHQSKQYQSKHNAHSILSTSLVMGGSIQMSRLNERNERHECQLDVRDVSVMCVGRGEGRGAMAVALYVV